MLLAKNFLSEEMYLNAKLKGVHIFLFNDINFIPPVNGNSKEIFFNCNAERVESTWYTWEANQVVISNFKLKFPQLFEINSFDITLAIQKAMFWANFKTGLLWHCVNKFFPNEKIYHIDAMHSCNKYGLYLRYWKARKTFRNKQPKTRDKQQVESDFVIYIKNNFQMGLYQKIVKKVGSNKQFQISVDELVDTDFLINYQLDVDAHQLKSKYQFAFPKINLLQLSITDRFTLHIILAHWQELVKYIDIGMQIVHPNLKAALINEAENGIAGAVLSEVFHANGSIVYNTMNGIKSGEAQDAYINFDKWFVWDEQMKDLLVKENQIDPEKLLVTGHLIEDDIRNYKYRNSLPFDIKQLKGKKVISLFSLKGKKAIKLEAIQLLYNLIKDDKSYFLMIRPHPAEKPEDYILPETPLDNICFIEYNDMSQNDTLHDQLFVSDLSIVFGSTVALDSKWMGVPCITFEIREKSFIYNIDNTMIFHVKNTDELAIQINRCLTERKKEQSIVKPSVSDLIFKEITSNNYS